eukprot:12913547-Prorocentrum_lima.AAC.1
MSNIIWVFELVPNPLDAIRSSGADANNASKAWTIRDVQAKCDILQIDSPVENEYTKHVLAGEHLPIQIESYHSQYS